MNKLGIGALVMTLFLLGVYYTELSSDRSQLNLAQVSSIDTVSSWWKLDEGSGATASDSSGSNAGTISGATWTTGKIGGGLSFDGVNDYVSLGSGSSLTPTSAMTIATWVKTNTTSTGQMILSKYREGASYPYQLRIQEGGSIRFSVKTGSDVTLTTTGSLIPANQWKHVVAVWDGSTMRVYVDGVLASPTASQSGTMSNTETDTRIGSASLGGLPFNGVIDEVQLYHHALSAEEVSNLFNTGKISSTAESGSTDGSSTEIDTPEPAPSAEESTPTPSPTVTLSASPISVSSGQSSTLTWSSVNATACTASGGWTGTKTTSGTQTVSPTSNTTYTLTCTKESLSATASVTLNIVTQTPTIPTHSFLINDTIQTTDRLNVRIEPSGKRMNSQPAGAKGKVISGPVKIREFTWWQVDFVNAPDGWVVENYIVKDSVTTPTPSPTVTLSASPISVSSGQSSTLTWSSVNATACTASGGWTGTKTTSGTQTVSPTSNTTYTLTCTGVGGSITQSVIISVNTTTSLPPTSGTLSISSIVQTFNTLGQGIVSSGFPLREGDLIEADITNNKICVFVNGVEQGTYIEALGGRFQDGSIRSVLIQFPYNIPSTSPINAEVRIGTTCAVPHIAKTRVSDQVYLSARVILPSDPVYLSDTWVTFQPMLPASSESSVAKAYFTTFLDFQFENGFPYSWHPNPIPGKLYELTAGSYQSTYESTRSLLAAWQKTGDTKYFYNAYQRAWHQLTKYSLPVKGYGYTPDPNPNGLPGNGSGLTAEWNSQRYVGLASAYLLSGLEEYRNSVALTASWKYGGIDTKAKATDPSSGWISSNYPGRFNIISTWAAGLTTLIDASQAYSGGAGGYGPRQTVTNPDVRLPWILDAWELNKFAKGDFRDGLVGTSPTATNGGTSAPGDIPLFQVALLGDYLIFYYTNIQADPRIPGWLQKMADIAIGQTVALQSGDTCYGTGALWGYNYNLSSTQGRLGGVAPYTLPMWSNVFAFNYAKTGDSKYLTWYQRAADKRNVEPGYCLYWAWKYWGESFGNVMSAPFYAQKGLPKLPQAIRIPPAPGTPPVTSH